MRASKNKHRESIMLTSRFVLKVMNNDKKTLIHHGIIDHIAQQIVSVITQVCKVVNSSEPTELKFLIYLFI